MVCYFLIEFININSPASSEQRPLGQKSSEQDLVAAATYEHCILQQASKAAAPTRKFKMLLNVPDSELMRSILL
jgi:hypothetical protein